MIVTVCIGSSCHFKGSRAVVTDLQRLIGENNLNDKVELKATFCMNRCEQGVCVTVDGVLFSVSPDTVEGFFKDEILGKLK